MSISETAAILSAAFRQLSDALHLASVACKDLEYTIPQLASSSSPPSTVLQTPQPQQHPKKVKRVREPNEPRRPPSAYLLFANEARAKLVKDGTELKPAELMTKLGAMWSELDDSKKQVLFLTTHS
jgi:HMG (high mobility group) box